MHCAPTDAGSHCRAAAGSCSVTLANSTTRRYANRHGAGADFCADAYCCANGDAGYTDQHTYVTTRANSYVRPYTCLVCDATTDVYRRTASYQYAGAAQPYCEFGRRPLA